MAGEILDRLRTFLGNVNPPTDTFGTKPIYNEEAMHRLFEFVIGLEPDQLTDDQSTILYEIISDIELNYEDV